LVHEQRHGVTAHDAEAISSVSGRRQFDPTVNYYAVLDVPIDAGREEIIRTYRALMRLTHPDNFTDPHERAKAEARTKDINAAYAVLSRPELRQEYDQVMRRQLMAELIMQRYSGARPQGSRQFERVVRPPSPQVVRAQREATNGAIFRLLLTFAGAAAVIAAFVLIFAVVSSLI
jgi:curved DNA-binding protein CbpA